MNKQILKEFILAVGILIIISLCLSFRMPTHVYMMLHGVLIIFFGIFSFLVWTSKPDDERQKYHKALSSEIAFFSGTSMLVVAIAYQNFFETHVDAWLLVSLAVMVFSRTFIQYFLEKRR